MSATVVTNRDPQPSSSRQEELRNSVGPVDSIIHLSECKAPWLDQSGFLHLDRECR